jgi:hypothetical protein
MDEETEKIVRLIVEYARRTGKPAREAVLDVLAPDLEPLSEDDEAHLVRVTHQAVERVLQAQESVAEAASRIWDLASDSLPERVEMELVIRALTLRAAKALEKPM